MAGRFLVVEFEDPDTPLARFSANHPGVTLDIAIGPGWAGPDGLRFTLAVLARGCSAKATRELEDALRQVARHVERVSTAPGDLVLTAQADASRVQTKASSALMAFEAHFEERWLRLEQGVSLVHARFRAGSPESLLQDIRDALERHGVAGQAEALEGPPPSARSWITLQTALGTTPADRGHP